MKRSDFIKASLAMAVTPMISSTTFGQNIIEKKQPPIRIGFIGCGGRGTGVISTMSRNTNIHIVALADLFQDRLDAAFKTVNQLNAEKGFQDVKPENIYRGESAYKQLLANDQVDAVLISTTAYAHPFIFDAAVKAKKHVYCEKPSAQDVYGTLKMMKSASGISDLSLTCGYQIRYASQYQEMVKRINDGAIGDVVTAQLFYNSSEVPKYDMPNISDDEFRLRNHFHFLALSGGILNDQAIHMLDICNWVLGATPISAIGCCSKKGGKDFGDTFSNYQVIYNYPNDINVSLQSNQVGPAFGDVCARFIGTKGSAEAHYSGGVFITGAHPWRAEDKGGLFDSDENKGKSFIESIENHKYINEVKAGCNSTLSALLGRDAAFSGNKLSWNDMIAGNNRMDPKLNLSLFK